MKRLLLALFLPLVALADTGGNIDLHNGASLGANSGNDLILYTSSSSDKVKVLGEFEVYADDDANRKLSFTASSDTALVLAFGDSGSTAAQKLSILSSTSDGDDDSEINICAGGACGSSRGAGIRAMGNEDADEAGDLVLGSGNVSGGDIILQHLGSTSATLSTTGLGFAQAGDTIGHPAAAVITPATAYPTPGDGSGLTSIHTYLASAAPTAAFVQLPRATAVAGQTYYVGSNAAANPVAIVPISGDTVNAAAAGTPYACAARKNCVCTSYGTTQWFCSP